MDVRTEPAIPKVSQKLVVHPDIDVWGRNPRDRKPMGKLIFLYNRLEGTAGYAFRTEEGHNVSPITLEQIAQKIREADAAVKAGLL
jgi:hypothetical protein